MDYQIPRRFQNFFVFVGSLFTFNKRQERQWIRADVLKSVKDSEYLNEYYNNLSVLSKKSVDDIATHFDVKIVVLRKDGRFDHGNGTALFLNIVKNPKIIFDENNFHYVPEGVRANGKILTRLDEMFIYRYLASQKVGQKLKRPEIIFEPCPLLSKKFIMIEESFNISITIWEKLPNKQYKQLRVGSCDKEHELVLHYQKDAKKLFLICNVKEYFKNFFQCKNFSSGCYFVFSDKNLLSRHEKICETPSQIAENFNVKQKEYGPGDRLINKAIHYGIVGRFPRNDNFIFYDVECVLPKTEVFIGKAKIMNNHKLVSLAVNSFINGVHEQKCWVVDNSSAESETRIVKLFLDYCYKKQKEMILPREIKDTVNKLKELSIKMTNDNFEIDEIYELLATFEAFLDLPVFGYNNAKYDNNIIFEHISKTLDCQQPKFDFRKVSILKKGTQYFSIKFNRIHFKDLINFTCPMKLDKYLKTWTSDFQKLVYPYELFSSVEEIRNCKTFPLKSDFYSMLSGEVDDTLYNSCKNEYNRRLALSETHPEKWNSFEDYLKYYNISDVYPASCALINQFKTFENNFGLTPMQSLGLPSYAKKVMFSLYDRSCPNIFSLPKTDSNATKFFRENIIGGICNVYKRHVTLLDEPAAKAAKENINGKFKSNYFCANSPKNNFSFGEIIS